MIKLGKPYIKTKSDFAYLKCDVCDEGLGRNFTLWFSVNHEYKSYLTPEVADAFVMIVLQVAMLSKQDITSEAPMSETLLFNLINGVMPDICRLYPDNVPIKINVETIKGAFNGSAVGTGCSLGVDSFSTIVDHMSEKFPKKLHLTHLALFNSGQHGITDLVSAEAQFFRDIETVQAPAKELGLKVIGINSNVNELFKAYQYPLLHRFVVTTCAFPLTVQKLFKTYIYASGYPIDKFAFDPSDIAHIEYAIVPLLGTECTSIKNSNPLFTRVDKTRLICDNPVVKKYLNVCWSHQLMYSYGTDAYIKGQTKLNCGMCDKCLRTMITLEILGKLDDFSEIFDIDAYKKYRSKYIVKILSMRDKESYYEEIYELMRQNKFTVSLKEKLLVLGVHLGLYNLVQKLFNFSVMAKGK